MTKEMYQAGMPPQSVNSLQYSRLPLSSVPVVNVPRAPTVNDGQFPLFTLWRNSDGAAVAPNAEGDLWYYARVDSSTDPVQYIWLKIATGSTPGGTLIGLEDDSSTQVLPDGAGFIQLEGDSGITVTADALNNKLVIALAGGSAAIDSVDVDFNTAPGTDPVVPDANGLISVYGNTVTNATNASAPVATHSRAANQFQVDVQLSTDLTGAPADPFDAGLCSFDDTAFAVDGNGYVTLVGGGGSPAYVSTNVDGNMAPGTDPVVADGSGQITVTGAQVAAGTIGANVIDTYSGAANTYAVRVQQADAAAAKDTTLNGVAHFDSAYFTDDEGFISTTGTGLGETITGDSGGALSPTAGNWNIVGGTGISTSGAGSTLTITNTDPGTGGNNGGFYLFDDFISTASVPSSGSSFSFTSDVIGGSSNFFSGSSGLGLAVGNLTSLNSGHPGIIQLEVGTNSSGIYIYSSSAIVLGDGETIYESLIRFEDLGNASHRFFFVGGLSNPLYTSSTDNVLFLYQDNINSGKFQCIATSSSTSTTADSGITVAADTWYKLRFVVNAAASSIEYFIDDVSVATISTNIPSAVIRPLNEYRCSSSISTQREMYIDYLLYSKTLTTPR